MEKQELISFLNSVRDWVQASVSPEGTPQSAVVGVAVTTELHCVFDTDSSSRKCVNLRKNPAIALTVWSGAITVQIDGTADEPTGEELTTLKKTYFAKFTDGPTRETWPGITYFRVKPSWIRISDFSTDPPTIRELTTTQILNLR